MLSYIIRRILATVPVMVVVALFVFSLLYIAPGDPAGIIAGDQATPEDAARIRMCLGLDRPWPWLQNLILPALALGCVYIALIARITRASMLEVLQQDYSRTARAKGVGQT